MTADPPRPEEERSYREATPEILLPPTPTTPQQIAAALVTKWETGLALFSGGRGAAHLVLTNDVREQMRDDIVALLNDTIAREHLG